MKKIISVFQRNYDGDRLCRNEIVPGAEWVIAGEGVATRKFDGSCCKVEGGALYRRYDAKNGKKPPDGFIPAQEPDHNTGHWPGWLEVGPNPSDKWYRVAFLNLGFIPPDGTYEAVGPHFQGNPEQMEKDVLVRHGIVGFNGFPRDFDGIKEALSKMDIEGVVFHHPDGRMAKVKKKDFGLQRKPTAPVADSETSRSPA